MRCVVCERKLNRVDTYGCNTCGAEWCEDCSQELFIFNNKKYCTLCWKNKPKRPRDDELLLFALDKFKTSRTELENEFIAKNRQKKQRNTYYCTFCPPNTCASSKCSDINDDCKIIGAKIGEVYRGICCKAAITQCGTEPDDFCEACTKWKRDRMILFLGIRKFRPKTLLAKLPRDLLRYIIEKE